MTNAEQLRRLMRRHDLTRPEVAWLLGVGGSTVGSWLAPAGTTSRREMPNTMLCLLTLEL